MRHISPPAWQDSGSSSCVNLFCPSVTDDEAGGKGSCPASVAMSAQESERRISAMDMQETSRAVASWAWSGQEANTVDQSLEKLFQAGVMVHSYNPSTGRLKQEGDAVLKASLGL